MIQEYEAWVLNDLRWAGHKPDKWSGICGGAFSTILWSIKRRNVMLKCGVQVITMEMVGRLLMISQKIVLGA